MGNVIMRDNVDHSLGHSLGKSFERQHNASCEHNESTKEVLVGRACSERCSEDGLQIQGKPSRADTVGASGRGVAGSGTQEPLDDNNTVETPIADAIEALLPEMRAYAKRLCKDDTLADDLV